MYKSIALSLFEYAYSNNDGFEWIDTPDGKDFDKIKSVKPDTEFALGTFSE